MASAINYLKTRKFVETHIGVVVLHLRILISTTEQKNLGRCQTPLRGLGV